MGANDVTCSARQIISLLCVTLAVTAFPALAVPWEPPPGLTMGLTDPDRGYGTFNVSGLDKAALDALAGEPRRMRDALAVFTVDDPKEGNGENDARPRVLGTYQVDRKAGVFRFKTRFPAEPGVHYRAVYRPPGAGGEPLVATFTFHTPGPTGPETAVTRVSPSGDVLPANLLKFYIEFSAPMSRGEAYANLRLLDDRGKPLDLPFLELGEELWDPRGVRFTLLFDPGRIKTGLKPREEQGPILEAGKAYTLVVGRDWRDAAGRPLKADFRKAFRAGPPDASPPDPTNWTLQAPAAGGREPLVARFPEPLDRAMLGRVLAVVGPGGEEVAGEIEVPAGETSWSFTPDRPWGAGGYTLRVDRSLEDLAGNSVKRPFEVDVFEKVERPGGGWPVSLPFTVRGAGGQKGEGRPAGG